MLNGFYMVGGRQVVDHHTRIDHARPRGTSREFYRGVLDGAARGVFNGKVIVHPDAQQTDAQQANHNLLLSKSVTTVSAIVAVVYFIGRSLEANVDAEEPPAIRSHIPFIGNLIRSIREQSAFLTNLG